MWGPKSANLNEMNTNYDEASIFVQILSEYKADVWHTVHIIYNLNPLMNINLNIVI